MKNYFLFILLCCTTSLFAQTITKAEVAKELNKIIQAMEIYHPNAYCYADSLDIAQLRDQLLNELSEAPHQADIYRAADRLVCAFGDGHTRVWDHNNWDNYVEGGGKFLPFEIKVKDGQLTITKAYIAEHMTLVGQNITSLLGFSSQNIIERLRQHASRETSALDDALLSRNFPYYFWRAFGSMMTNEVAERSDDIPAQPWVAMELTGGDQININTITAEALKTARGETPKRPVITAKVLDNQTAYLKIRHFEGRPKKYFKHFKNIFADFKAQGATSLILDLRNHGGGDSRVGDDLARYLAEDAFRQFAYSEWKASPAFKDAFKNVYLPGVIHWAIPILKGINPHTKAIYGAPDHSNARVEYKMIKPYGPKRAFQGEVIMLMDNHTFSAGTCFAAMFKDYQMGTIIGQESGNLANFHADGLTRLSLPLAGAQLQISNSYLVRPSGDESKSPVQPDIYISDGEDALKVALQHLSSRRPKREERAISSAD